MSIGTLLGRIGAKVSEAVGGQAKTVDQDFESKKALFKTFEKEFVLLHRRVQTYFKDAQSTVKNWERIVETTRVLYPPDQTFEVIDQVGKRAEEALKSYDGAGRQLSELMTRYEVVIKTMGRNISERDNARVDFDRARAKADKDPGNPVAEATARATEQVYVDTNFRASESLDYFLDTRLENVSAILSVLAQATVALYSSLGSFPPFDMVVAPAPELATAAGVPMSVGSVAPARSSSRTAIASNSVSSMPQAKSPRGLPALTAPLERASGTGPKSPRLAAVQQQNGGERGRSASMGAGMPNARPVVNVVPDRPPAKALPPLEKKAVSPRLPKVMVLYDFTPAPDDAEGIRVFENEELHVKEESADGEWLLCVSPRGSRTGFVPKNYTEPSYRPD